MSDDDKKLLREIHGCLIGDKLNGKPGLVDVVEQHAKDLYGDQETSHEGLKPKLEKLVEDNKRTRYTVVGIISVATAVVTLYACWDVIVMLFK